MEALTAPPNKLALGWFPTGAKAQKSGFDPGYLALGGDAVFPLACISLAPQVTAITTTLLAKAQPEALQSYL